MGRDILSRHILCNGVRNKLCQHNYTLLLHRYSCIYQRSHYSKLCNTFHRLDNTHTFSFCHLWICLFHNGQVHKDFSCDHSHMLVVGSLIVLTPWTYISHNASQNADRKALFYRSNSLRTPWWNHNSHSVRTNKIRIHHYCHF